MRIQVTDDTFLKTADQVTGDPTVFVLLCETFNTELKVFADSWCRKYAVKYESTLSDDVIQEIQLKLIKGVVHSFFAEEKN